METPVMTVLAEVRNTLRQQFGMSATMGFMARTTVLFNRRVLPDKRPALVCVTGVTKLITTVSSDHGFFRCAMRIMAVTARDFAFDNRMV